MRKNLIMVNKYLCVIGYRPKAEPYSFVFLQKEIFYYWVLSGEFLVEDLPGYNIERQAYNTWRRKTTQQAESNTVLLWHFHKKKAISVLACILLLFIETYIWMITESGTSENYFKKSYIDQTLLNFTAISPYPVF